MTSTLERLEATLRQRRGATPENSYVASLYAKGLNRILEKIGEEATETIIAAKDHAAASPVNRAQRRAELVGEVADLWFHSMVMLVQQDLSAEDVLAELERRTGVSGHEEKAQRTTAPEN